MSPDRTIDPAPGVPERGRRAFSFFDWDGTLFLGAPAIIEAERYFSREQAADPAAAERAFERWLEHERSMGPRAKLNDMLIARYRGRSVQQVEATAERFAREICSTGLALNADAARLMRVLRDEGLEPVIVTGSPSVVVRPMAARLGVRHVLGADLIHHDGIFDGTYRLPQTIGPGKAVAISQFLALAGSDEPDCAGCGDHESDVPMLEGMGRAWIVAGNEALESVARVRGWGVIGIIPVQFPRA